nr:MAG TPA: Transcription initiation factor TFIIIB, Brf1 subunit/Transcription initiation factor TFIIB [Caudoviricetes sp.]
MIKDTYLTDAFGEFWWDGDKAEYLEALDGAIDEIGELGCEIYAKRTLEKLKEMKECLKERIAEDIRDDGACPNCGEDMEYDDKYGEYVCPDCGSRYEDSYS